MPALGLGTWQSEPGEVGAAVRQAIEIGYRHIDCAPIYGNEPEVGQAIAAAISDGVVLREDLWITSKLWNNTHARADVVPALAQTLEDLQLDYLDLYLIHWPIALKEGVPFPETGADFLSLDDRPLEETWRGLQEGRAAGLCRHIGVSNFSAHKIQALLDCEGLGPEVNQVELHPFLQQNALLRFCTDHHVVLTGYSPLGSQARPARLKPEGEPVLLEDDAIQAVAARLGATSAQVVLAWAIQRGTSVIPKSVRRERLAENLEAANLVLTDEHMATIAHLDRHRRYISGEFWAKEGSPYTLENLWDEA